MPVPAAPPNGPLHKSGSEFVPLRPDEDITANAAPALASANAWLGPSPEGLTGPKSSVHILLGFTRSDFPGLGPSHEPAVESDPVDESMESPAPQGQAQDEGMDLEVLEEEL